jgi:hypothetical protein
VSVFKSNFIEGTGIDTTDACYHSVQSLLSSRLLSKNLKIRIYKTINNKVEEDEIGGSSSTNGEKRNTYRLLVGKPEGKRPLRRPRRRWVGNIRMDLGEVGCGDVDWIGLAQDGTGGELL